MTKKLVVILLTMAIVASSTVCGFADTKTSTRTANGKVIGMYGTDNEDYVEITVKTADGNYWNVIVESDTDLKVYTKVKVKFDTQGTKSKYDDVVKDLTIRG